MHVVYLHGFASGARTEKGNRLRQRLAGRCASYTIPDLEGGDFAGLTFDRLADRAAAAVAALPDDGRGALLVGSSLGGYLAALLAAQGRVPRARALVLIAPAFGFTTTMAARLGPHALAAWQRQGALPFWHHGEERELPLGWAFHQSCAALPELPGEPGIPAAVVHGRQDGTVDHRFSVRWAQERAGAELHLVEGDHRLTEPRHEALIAWCAEDLIARATASG
ncbi:MAG: alpha/beta fold hydrolase [Planctomycetes bacterium]|nr:alpha/beta fold hydrolase [Planctomycetota bacterium]